MKLRLQPGAPGAGRQHDAVDHGPDHLHRGHPLVAVAEHGLELCDLPSVQLRQVGRQQHLRRLRAQGVDLGGECGALGLQGGQPLLQGRAVHPVLHRLQDRRDLPVDADEGALLVAAPVPGFGLITPLRHHHFLNKGGDHVSAEQALLQPGKNTALDCLPADGAVVRAGARIPVAGATVAVLAHDGVAAAADAAHQHAGQKEAPPMHAVQSVALVIPTDLGGNRLLSHLDAVP
nr:hypothetical protein [Azospirillum sp. B510]